MRAAGAWLEVSGEAGAEGAEGVRTGLEGWDRVGGGEQRGGAGAGGETGHWAGGVAEG